MRKPIAFMGSSRKDLIGFPEPVRQQVGYQLDRVQQGLTADNWKPLSVVGPGVQEIRVVSEEGIWRVVYVAKFAEAIYVLHCFQKKTQATSLQDIRLARQRYHALLQERNQ
jgi:phage-related protein